MLAKLAVIATLALAVLGHGVHDEPEDVAKFRRDNIAQIAAIHKRCAGTLESIQRRRLVGRGLIGADAPAHTLQRAAVCTLAPELTEGPYYVNNELFRSNITDGQSGVPIQLRMTILDISTCAVVPNDYVELWAANSTGYYSGFTTSQLDNLTFQRGVARADANGVATINGLFPGWYTGRTVHWHVRVFSANSTVASNGLFQSKSGVARHTGQIFYDQSLIAQVAALSPYSTNKQAYSASTKNAQDGIFSGASAGGYNPLMTTSLVGSTLSQGLIGEIVIAINSSFVSPVQATVTHTARTVKVTDEAA